MKSFRLIAWALLLLAQATKCVPAAFPLDMTAIAQARATTASFATVSSLPLQPPLTALTTVGSLLWSALNHEPLIPTTAHRDHRRRRSPFRAGGVLSGPFSTAGTTSLSRIDALSFEPSGGVLDCAVVDPTKGFAYFGTADSPGRVIKVRLSDFARVGVLTLNAGEDYLASTVIDPAGEFVYFGTDTSPGRVVKVRLSDFARVGVLTLETGEDYLASAAIDPEAGFAYFGTETSPGQVVKVVCPT